MTSGNVTAALVLDGTRSMPYRIRVNKGLTNNTVGDGCKWLSLVISWLR